MKMLVVGPSPTKSKGGMATVIEEIKNDNELNRRFDIDIYESYIDGNKLQVLFFSLYAFVKFYFTKRNYDIYYVHAASYGSTFRKGWYVYAAKKWGKKVFLHIHGAEYMIFYNKSKRKKKIISILKRADKVIVLSPEWKRRFDNTFELENCVALENGIDEERLKPAITDPEEHPHVLVSLGRLGQRKGTYDLINAIEIVKEKIPDVKCYLAGDGEIEKCRDIIQKKNLNDSIILTGWVGFDDKLDLLKKSSIFVLPSYNEGLPMAILESMACGKVVISTTVGAIPEVVKADNGILIQPGDVNALASAIIKYCNDLQAIRTVGKNNISFIRENYSMKVMHQRLAEILLG